tara:strand:- start:427 stop:591 length:165 start_codon:yes stop_codon:yes gene_type:complete
MDPDLANDILREELWDKISAEHPNASHRLREYIFREQWSLMDLDLVPDHMLSED